MNTAHSGAAAPGVVVTRPAAQAGALADALARQGFDPVLFGALEIVPLDPLPPPPDRFDCAVFISRNAVECGSAVVLGNPPAGGALVAAIGEGTANALRERGVEHPLFSADGADSEALLALPQIVALRGRRVVVVRGVGGRERLADGLRALGAAVEYFECYRRVRPAADPSALLERWRQGGVVALSTMSVETLENFTALLGPAGAELLRTTPLFVPHERVAAAARDAGIEDVIVCGTGDRRLVDAICARFRESAAARS